MRTPTVIAFGSLIGVVAGCFLNSSSKSISDHLQATKTFPTKDSLSPDALPYSTARLILFGTTVPVDMEREVSGSKVSFRLEARKAVIEEEHYVSEPTVFSYAGLSDESFDKPIPIARFPLNVGDTWDWEGDTWLGPNKKHATAAITTSSETLNLAGGVYECVAVAVDLTVDSGDGSKTKRTLRFWIQPKKGIVKREFGFSTTREPRPAGSP